MNHHICKSCYWFWVFLNYLLVVTVNLVLCSDEITIFLIYTIWNLLLPIEWKLSSIHMCVFNIKIFVWHHQATFLAKLKKKLGHQSALCLTLVFCHTAVIGRTSCCVTFTSLKG